MATAEHLTHLPVMGGEAVGALLAAPAPTGGRVFVDATFGGGGHSRLILEKLTAADRLLALDCDEYAAARAAQWPSDRFAFDRCNYSQLADVLIRRGLSVVTGILFDLGISSLQVDTASRGFSFRLNGDLDMRLDRRLGPSAAEWLATSDEKTIHRVLRDYGEEPEARRLSHALYLARHRLSSTAQLGELVCETKRRPAKPGRHPATQVFQALRMAVNQELRHLQKGLEAAVAALQTGGRLVVIAFHSVEDRLVKHFSAGVSFPGLGAVHKPPLSPVGRLRRPSESEIADNPRARSARMRVFVKTAAVRHV
jgi:16S rRNA (cytosine1402-N4)-methyltransferase